MNTTTVRYQYVQTDEELSKVFEILRKATILGVDSETTGLDPKKDRLRVMQIATNECTIIIDWFKISQKSKKKIKIFLEQPIIKIFHNAKFDLSFLYQEGIKIVNHIYDTQVASQLLCAGLKRKGFTLAEIAMEYLGFTLPKDSQKSDWSGELTKEQLEYAAKDAAILLDLGKTLNEQLVKEGLVNVANIEFLAIPALVEMELTGIGIDTNRVEGIKEEIFRHKGLLLSQVQKYITSNVNINSPSQLKKALNEIGIPVMATSKKDLIPFAKTHPVIQVILDYKKAEKLVQFTRKIVDAVNEQTNHIHSSYYQCGTMSGRVSCSNFNLQQVPNNKVFRSCFVAGEGKKLVIADYSQIELRIAAEISGDEKMIRAYRNEEDLHQLTASLVNQKPMNAVTSSERQSAKCLNFGLLYGMGAKGLAEYALTNYNIVMSEYEAKQFRTKFFNGYPGLKRWHQQFYNRTVKEITTLSGRKRKWAEKAPFTQLTNTPVQGTGADILKRALGVLPRSLQKTSAKLIATVHDEIILLCDESESKYVSIILKEVMEQAGREFLSLVPVIAEPTIADHWGGK